MEPELCAEPISLPASSGMTKPIALAAPVEFGTILIAPSLWLCEDPLFCADPSKSI